MMALNGALMEEKKLGVNWKQVGMFVGLTLALSWLLDLVLWMKFGYGKEAALFLQLQMLIPAFVAIVLQRYVFKDSPLYRKNLQGRARWFFGLFQIFTLVFFALVVLVSLNPELYPVPLASVVMLFLVVSMIALIVIRVLAGKEAFRNAGLSGGKAWSWPVVWFVVLAYLFLQVGLTAVFGMGARPDLSEMAAGAGMTIPVLMVVSFVNTAMVGPLLGLLIAFGEEYGWRGYLQSELIKLGRVKGVLLVGVVWGVWHAPVIAMGHNYPGHPVLGPIAFLVFNLILSVFLGYLVLKTGSVWQAALMHAILNQGYAWMIAIVNTPNDPLYSFGAGFYGIGFALVVALLLLRDRVWKQAGQ